MTQFVSPNNLMLSKNTDRYKGCRCPTLAITGACHDWGITGVNDDKKIFFIFVKPGLARAVLSTK